MIRRIVAPMTKTSQSIENAFSRAAPDYDGWARAQRRAAKRLVAMLPNDWTANRIADLGCGTGAVIAELLARFPATKTRAIDGVDLSLKMIEAAAARFENDPRVRLHLREMLAFLDHALENAPDSTGSKYDMILSNFAAQWIERPERLCVSVLQRLTPGGLFALCVPCEGSLRELHDAVAQSGRTLNTLFRPADDWRDAILDAGFQLVRWEEDDLIESYATGREAMASVHRIGAASALQAGRRRLTVAQTRRVLRILEATPSGEVPSDATSSNENAATNRGVTMTYRAVWCVARR